MSTRSARGLIIEIVEQDEFVFARLEETIDEGNRLQGYLMNVSVRNILINMRRSSGSTPAE